MSKKFCEIFKTGLHTDSNGNQREWTLSDLNKIVSNFEEKNLQAAICCGHPKSNTPAYGWVDKLKVEGNKLLATFKDVQEEFKEAVNKGLFKNRSISLTPDLSLRHIAFLGAQPPAIKGLEKFCFQSAAGDDVMNIDTEVRILGDVGGTPSGAFQSAAEDIIINFENMEENNIQLDSQKCGASELPHKQKGTEMTEELKKVQEELAQKNSQIETLQNQLKQKELDAQNKDFEDFCEKAIQEGNILPA
ncbi:hypothetical protein IJ531_00965 [bacterium]|nr:hypothetical protein [bacterium]